MLLDLAGSLPYDLIIHTGSVGSAAASGVTRMLRCIRIFKMLRRVPLRSATLLGAHIPVRGAVVGASSSNPRRLLTTRIIRLVFMSKFLTRVEAPIAQFFEGSRGRLLTLFGVTAFTVHIFTCALFWSNALQGKRAGAHTRPIVVSQPAWMPLSPTGFPDNSIAVVLELVSDPRWKQYFWFLLTAGSVRRPQKMHRLIRPWVAPVSNPRAWSSWCAGGIYRRERELQPAAMGGELHPGDNRCRRVHGFCRGSDGRADRHRHPADGQGEGLCCIPGRGRGVGGSRSACCACSAMPPLPCSPTAPFRPAEPPRVSPRAAGRQGPHHVQPGISPAPQEGRTENLRRRCRCWLLLLLLLLKLLAPPFRTDDPPRGDPCPAADCHPGTDHVSCHWPSSRVHPRYLAHGRDHWCPFFQTTCCTSSGGLVSAPPAMHFQ